MILLDCRNGCSSSCRLDEDPGLWPCTVITVGEDGARIVTSGCPRSNHSVHSPSAWVSLERSLSIFLWLHVAEEMASMQAFGKIRRGSANG